MKNQRKQQEYPAWLANPSCWYNQHIRFRLWNDEDTTIFRTMSGYPDPFHELWNLPRPPTFGDRVCALFFWHRPIRDRQSWAIENERGNLVGRISLRDIEWQRQARLGIALGAPYVGYGLGSRSLSLFLDHFFGPPGFATIVLEVAAFNHRAVRCYQRLGFTIVRQEWRYAGNHPCLQLLENPDYDNIRAYFRRGTDGMLAQFLEMALSQEQWHNNKREPVGNTREELGTCV